MAIARLFAYFLLGMPLLTGCDLPGRPDPGARPTPADQVTEFTTLYGQNCAGCHGADGKLGPAPPLNDALFRAIVPEEELQEVIARGRDKTLMPAFAKENGGALTAMQIDVMVKEIKGIPYKIVEKQVVPDADGPAPKWGTPVEAPKGVPAYRAPPSSVGNKEKGALVFARACAECHGSAGKGGDKAGAINDRAFLALSSDQVLRRYVITGRPDLGMPNFAARPRWHFVPLTDADVADVIALLASWRGEK